MIVDEEMNKWNFEFEQAVVIMSTNLTLVRKEMICCIGLKIHKIDLSL